MMGGTWSEGAVGKRNDNTYVNLSPLLLITTGLMTEKALNIDTIFRSDETHVNNAPQNVTSTCRAHVTEGN